MREFNWFFGKLSFLRMVGKDLDLTVRCLTVTLSAMLLTLAGCSDTHSDPRLEQIRENVDKAPENAIEDLKKIDYKSLDRVDRHLYDLLSIKANDKAFVRHTSDSLIRDVIHWYRQHPKDGLYPEALYYGGRVYSDLGDRPTALRYFQMALDELPDSTDQPLLRACVLSQTGRLLNSLRLYKEAIPYIKQCIQMDQWLNDSINEVHDLLMLGSAELRDSNYQEAKRIFHIAYDKSQGKGLPEELLTLSRMYLGAINYYTGNIDTALTYIRNIPEEMPETGQNTALAYAARIYQGAGITDTAYMYAEKLIDRPRRVNKITGFQILLSPELRSLIPLDSLESLLLRYNECLNKEYNDNQNQLSLSQQTLYNYEFHKKEKERTLASNRKIKTGLSIALGAICLLIILYLALKIKNQKNLLSLHHAIDNLNQLRISIAAKDGSTVPNPSTLKTDAAIDVSSFELPVADTFMSEGMKATPMEDADSLRSRLRTELMDLYGRSEKICLSPLIINSEAYKEVQRRVEHGQVIKDDDALWAQLEETVLTASPEFLTRLRFLTLGNITTIELKTALLVKCHIKPSQMSVLFGKSNGAIISRRETLCQKIFDEKLGAKITDGIIRLL